MTLSLKHAFTSAKGDGTDPTEVQPSNWNAEHTITAGANTVVGNPNGTSGAASDITCTAAGRALIDDADAAAQRTTLGLGAVSCSGTVTTTTGNVVAGGAFNGVFTTIASSGTTNIGAAAANYLQVTGTTTITAFDTVTAGIWRIIEFAGILTLTHNATTLILPGGLSITTAAGDTGLFVSEGAGNWRCVSYQRKAIPPAGLAPTVQRFFTGTAQTYTAPAGVVRQKVTMWGPGAGACAQATNAGSNGSADTSFQVNATGTAWTAVKGSGGGLFSGAAAGVGGVGGTGGTNGSTGTLIARADGGDGDDGDMANNGSDFGAKSGAHGGQNARFGGGGKRLAAAGAGQNAKTNTGGGGASARHATANTSEGGAGGAGEFVEFWVTGMTTALYTVGLGGAGGAAGGAKGGDGASGGIIVEEFYS